MPTPEKKPPTKKKKKRRPLQQKPGEKPVSQATLKLRLLKRLKCTLKYEKLAWTAGAKLVAGVDEVGRGSLFGPVVAAAVILDPGYRIRGLRDSKLLDRETREKLAVRIREHASHGRSPRSTSPPSTRSTSTGPRSGPWKRRWRISSFVPTICWLTRYAWLRVRTDADHPWRCAVGVHRGGVHHRQGRAGRDGQRLGPGVS